MNYYFYTGDVIEMIAEYSKTYFKMINEMSKTDDKTYMESLLSYSTSLISSGIKPAVTLTLMSINNRNLNDLWVIYGKAYVHKLNLNYVVLREIKESTILLIYEHNLLENSLNEKHNSEFLETCGYEESDNLYDKLAVLKRRYSQMTCPHELGIFLGYPVDDVRDFMKDCKKPCKLCGYWKVYNSKEKAEKIFALFDKVKNNAAEKIINELRELRLAEQL